VLDVLNPERGRTAHWAPMLSLVSCHIPCGQGKSKAVSILES